jgi:hypothetical protein
MRQTIFSLPRTPALGTITGKPSKPLDAWELPMLVYEVRPHPHIPTPCWRCHLWHWGPIIYRVEETGRCTDAEMHLIGPASKAYARSIG